MEVNNKTPFRLHIFTWYMDMVAHRILLICCSRHHNPTNQELTKWGAWIKNANVFHAERIEMEHVNVITRRCRQTKIVWCIAVNPPCIEPRGKRITHRKTHSHISQIWINIARCWRSESRAHFVTQWRKGSRRTSSVRSRSCKTKTASDLVNKAINISAAVLCSFTRAQCFICSGIHMKCKQPIRVEWVVTKSEQCSYKISRLAYSKHKREKSNCIAPRVEGVWEWSTFNDHKYFELFPPLSLSFQKTRKQSHMRIL